MDTVVSVTTEDFEDVIDYNKNPYNDGDSKKWMRIISMSK